MTHKNTTAKLTSSSTAGCALLIASIALLSGHGKAQAAVADFSEGVGTTSASHQYVGTAGEDWLGPWAAVPTNTTMDATVTNNDPIVGTDNYLQMEITGGATSSRRSALNRGVEASLAEDAHSIAFTLRVDKLTGFGSGDFIGIFSTETAQASTTSTSSQTWGLIVSGTSGNISFRDGESNSINTGLDLTAGVTYDFLMEINPLDSTWTGSISTSAGPSFTSPTMNFRKTTATGRYVNINSLMNTTGDEIDYSLTGLSVTAIPESSSTSLYMLLTCLVLVPFLRKRIRK